MKKLLIAAALAAFVCPAAAADKAPKKPAYAELEKQNETLRIMVTALRQQRDALAQQLNDAMVDRAVEASRPVPVGK